MADVTVAQHIDDFMTQSTRNQSRKELGIASYASVSNLIGDADVSKITTGDYVELTGYYSDVPFGQPIMLKVEAAEGGVDSHTLADGRYANLYVEGSLNVKWIGAKGTSAGPDGDDVGATFDDGPFIQEAIKIAMNPSYSVDEVYIPEGCYQVATKQTITNGSSKDIGILISWVGTQLGVAAKTRGSVRIRGAGRKGNGATDEGGTIITYTGTDPLDALFYGAGDNDAFQGISDIQLYCNNDYTPSFVWAPDEGDRTDPTDDDSSIAFTSTYNPFSEWVVDFGIQFENTIESGYTSKYELNRVVVQRAKEAGYNIGSVFGCTLEHVEATNNLKDGMRIGIVTNVMMNRVVVNRFYRYGIKFDPDAVGYYSTLRNCVVEKWNEPDNPDFNPYDASKLADPTNLDYRPWLFDTSTTLDDWLDHTDVDGNKESSWGTAFYFEPKASSYNPKAIHMDACGIEGARIYLWGTGYIHVDQNHMSSSIGGRNYQTKLGQLTADVAAPFSGSSVTFDVDFDPTTSLSAGDTIIVGRRTAAPANWSTAYPRIDDPDNLVTSSGTAYGYLYLVTAVSAGPNQITADRFDITGSAYAWNADSTEWPGEVTTHVGTGGSEDFVLKWEMDLSPVVYVEGTDDAFDPNRSGANITITGGAIGGATGRGDSSNQNRAVSPVPFHIDGQNNRVNLQNVSISSTQHPWLARVGYDSENANAIVRELSTGNTEGIEVVDKPLRYGDTLTKGVEFEDNALGCGLYFEKVSGRFTEMDGSDYTITAWIKTKYSDADSAPTIDLDTIDARIMMLSPTVDLTTGNTDYAEWQWRTEDKGNKLPFKSGDIFISDGAGAWSTIAGNNYTQPADAQFGKRFVAMTLRFDFANEKIGFFYDGILRGEATATGISGASAATGYLAFCVNYEQSILAEAIAVSKKMTEAEVLELAQYGPATQDYDDVFFHFNARDSVQYLNADGAYVRDLSQTAANGYLVGARGQKNNEAIILTDYRESNNTAFDGIIGPPKIIPENWRIDEVNLYNNISNGQTIVLQRNPGAGDLISAGSGFTVGGNSFADAHDESAWNGFNDITVGGSFYVSPEQYSVYESDFSAAGAAYGALRGTETINQTVGGVSEATRFYANTDALTHALTAEILNDTSAAWATSTGYVVGDMVEEAGTNYTCIEAHTSGTFATDLAAGKWQVSLFAASADVYVPSGSTTARGVLFTHDGAVGIGDPDAYIAYTLETDKWVNLSGVFQWTRDRVNLTLIDGNISGAMVNWAGQNDPADDLFYAKNVNFYSLAAPGGSIRSEIVIRKI